MEILEKPYKKSPEAKEKEPHYNFKEMAELEPAVIEVAQQLKEKIENGEYDALISDDAGGRIPTLILRKVFGGINPNKDIKTRFISAGHSFPDKWQIKNYQKLLDYLKEFKKENISKVLVVTQFIFKGGTMAKLLGALKDSGIEGDVAALDVAFPDDAEINIPEGVNLYFAPKSRIARGDKSLKISEQHEKLSGVEKAYPYSPIPVPMRNRKTPLITYEDYLRLNEKYYGKEDVPYKERDPEKEQKIDAEYNRSITPKETQEIQKNINLAREDVEVLADRAVKKILGK